ncbi:MAG: hypothetical protein EPO51_08960 [Phenylobacterium sp.]|uniref:hypothetical protein n=1 Tax=Phenylobacterium sp. TaxID=1871053 RepID=UPI0012135F3C|nr:hypothetical protein [Phenylobacterium sp.]TAJ72230.1 MAG: hypothetical protein EPO51_08960 [Phenylobacterium sp.]
MRGSIVTGLAAALVAGAAAAQAAPDGDALTLLCQGTEVAVLAPMGWNRGYGLGGGYREGRQPAQLVIVLEGGKVRVRPPELTVPVYAKRAADGWYALTDTSVDKFTILGRANFSRIDRYKLNVDRRTGAVTFGTFSGICNRVASTPEATRF